MRASDRLAILEDATSLERVMRAGHFVTMMDTETSGQRAARSNRSYGRKVMSSFDTYQHVVARSLIDSLGVDGALEFCCKNRWEGVLEAITNLVPRSAARHSATMPVASADL